MRPTCPKYIKEDMTGLILSFKSTDFYWPPLLINTCPIAIVMPDAKVSFFGILSPNVCALNWMMDS